MFGQVAAILGECVWVVPADVLRKGVHVPPSMG